MLPPANLFVVTEIVKADEYEEALEDNVPERYQEFRDAESIPVHTGLYIDDVNEVETGPWDRTDQQGAFINMYGAEGIDDLHVHDIEPGGETSRQNHLYEEVVLVTRGQGLTVFGSDDETGTMFEWKENSLFFIPPNTPYKHVNTSDDTTARLISQTPLPELMNLIEDVDLIFPPTNGLLEKPIDDSEYTGDGTLISEPDGSVSWDTNFIPNIGTFDKIQAWDKLGSLRFVRLMLPSTMGAHIGEIPARMYKSAHRHGPGASVFILSGEGYSLLWQEDMDKKIEIEWSPRSVFAPPARWFHQHFNHTEEPARTFAIHCPDLGTLNDNRTFAHYHSANTIHYADEDPLIRDKYEELLAERGMESALPEECYSDREYSFEYREEAAE